MLTFVASYFQLLLPIEHLLYDRLLRLQNSSHNQELVIVAIDENSLQQYGPLPWAREKHAKLINQLTKAQVKAVGYDVLFNKSQSPADAQLVQAVQDNGKVIFPVIIERVTQTGELIELMPFPELMQAANNLGLVHFELSDDNIARSSYLKAGLGEPYWRAFAAELLDVANGDEVYQFPFAASDKKPSYDLTQIEQQHRVYLPFKQNPFHYKQLSFAEVAETDLLLDELTDKVVLVGVTATAARNADFLPVPVDRDGQIMSGVEINATLYEALKKEQFILPASRFGNALIAALFTFLFFLTLPKSLPRRNFFYAIAFLLGLLAFSWWLLHLQQRWLQVATPAIAIILGYLIWAWLKVVANMSFFKNTIERLSLETQESMTLELAPNSNMRVKFLSYLNLLDVTKYQAESKDVNPETEDLLKFVKQQASAKEKALVRKIQNQSPHFEKLSEQPEYGIIEGRIEQLNTAITQINFLRRFTEQTMDRMSDGIVLSDINGQIFYSNLVAKRYFSELREHKLFELPRLLNEIKLADNKLWEEKLKRVLQDGIVSELVAVTSDGRDLKISISLLDNVSGRDFIILNMVDISAIKREQRRQLEMIDFISHDLRSPMTSILALLSRYQRQPEKYDSQQMHQEIEQLTRSSLSLAEQFLMLSRAESSIELALYPIELLNTIDNAIGVVLPQAANKDIDLQFDFAAHQDVWIKANQDLLERVLTNLLTNAVKYSPARSQVNIVLEQAAKHINIRVIDQGEGINQEQMDAIFKPFTRMQKHEMAKVKGIGLGLRFVRAAMMRLGGTVAVESPPGKGACFILSLPRHLKIENP
ncbi:CHASE2 domain-containing protein [Kangiella sp. TOML190]|uniref:CHASE2 domain-containing protein n=1 Tax=Kangiella sp. TOML190 TaxID=2931351 RepID=UPI00203F1232|nr:CHASE2 domain-containing protein [Kangiella sp. TOML190]